MTRRSRHFLLLAILIGVVPLLLASGQYRFTFSNPAIGSIRAEYVLEYFASADCLPCRRFELQSLPGIQPFIDAGKLRLVFRDLPVDEQLTQYNRQLFCLQEFADYLELRRQAKVATTVNWQQLPVLSGLAKVRHAQCIRESSADVIHEHNQREFRNRHLQGTPAFTLFHVRPGAVSQAHWSGPTSSEQLLASMQALQSAAPDLASP